MMRSIKSFSFIVAILLYIHNQLAFALYSKSSPVKLLSSSSFDKLISKDDQLALIEFFAPWCGHCKQLQPIYESVAKSLKGLVTVAAIDCDNDKNKGVCGSQGIQGFPTIKLAFQTAKGKKRLVDYKGERTKKAILDFINDKMASHVTQLNQKNVASFTTTKDDDNESKLKVVMMGEKTMAPLKFKALARKYRKQQVKFGYFSKENKAVENKQLGFIGLETPSVKFFDRNFKELKALSGAKATGGRSLDNVIKSLLKQPEEEDSNAKSNVKSESRQTEEEKEEEEMVENNNDSSDLQKKLKNINLKEFLSKKDGKTLRLVLTDKLNSISDELIQQIMQDMPVIMILEESSMLMSILLMKLEELKVNSPHSITAFIVNVKKKWAIPFKGTDALDIINWVQETKVGNIQNKIDLSGLFPEQKRDEL